jgi:UDP-N-acetylglucosamine:LPS N-acetylglucosamine transferase
MKRPPRVLAVASGGGHWVQLQRLRPAFEDADVAYMTTEPGYRGDVPGARFYAVPDANRWNKIALARSLARITLVVLRERPDVVITTGAAPGFFALRIAKLLGARTMWLDSIANVEEMSMSGRLAGRHADRWLTQWPELAERSVAGVGRAPEHHGAVL